MSTEHERASHPMFSPLAFGIMSALVLHTHVTQADLNSLLKVKDGVLDEELQALMDKGDVEKYDMADQKPGLAYSVTAKGRTAFFEQIAWLKRMITSQE